MSRRVIVLIALVASLTVGVTGIVLARGTSLPSDLQAVRAAVARYHSYDQALVAGYDIGDEPCISSPAGTMGYHAVNLGLLASGVIDPLRPPILLYAPRTDGSMRLVGVEYFMAALVNTADGPRPWFSQEDPRDQDPPLTFFNHAPSLFGRTFDGPMAGHNPNMPWHYDLHAWVVEENPAGTFAQFNPAVSC